MTEESLVPHAPSPPVFQDNPTKTVKYRVAVPRRFPCKLCLFNENPTANPFGEQKFPVLIIHHNKPLWCPTCAYSELTWRLCPRYEGYVHATCEGCGQACETLTSHPRLSPTPKEFFVQ